MGAGRLVPAGAGGDADSPYLRGVPPELRLDSGQLSDINLTVNIKLLYSFRDKILAFHRVLSSPDNFTGSAASGQVPASPGHEESGGGGASSGGNMRGFGLAEVSSEDEARRDKPVDKDAGELQTDLFR